MGSNAIRYSAAEFSDVDHFSELEGQRFAVRLGHDTFRGGTLSPETIGAAVAAAVLFRTRLDDLGITHYRAVATSAVRESRNGGELVDGIRRESGIHLETITGSEETRLVWMAVQKRVPLDWRPWILADLGGGSMEISIVSQDGIHGSESHPMGTVRLLEDLSRGGQDPEAFRHLLERYTTRLTLPPGAEGETEGIIITGGNAEALADLAGAPRDERGVSEFPRRTLDRVLDRIAAMPLQDRVHRLGMREDRADVIVPAGIIFQRVAALTASDRILVPRVGVKDGILYDLAADFAEHREHEGELDRITFAGALGLGRRYRFDESHARHVRDLSLSLFDQLRSLHRLGEVSRRRLSTAALLHEIGQFVSYRRHHKHSWYLLSHSELPGLSSEDIRIVALVTRYHRRSEPKDYHEGYRELPAKGKAEVQKLAAILRIADALDREHHHHVRHVTVDHAPGKVLLVLQTGEDTVLEEWSLQTKAPLFERVYGVKLLIT